MSILVASIVAGTVLGGAGLLHSHFGTVSEEQDGKRKIVVITGGTSGLGRALVERLSQDGDRVFTCGRNARALEELNELENVTAIQCDITSEDSVAQFANRVQTILEEEEGEERGIDALVNNAGAQIWGHPMLEMSTETFDQSYFINVRGPFLCSREFFKLLKTDKKRKAKPMIINVGSVVENGPLAQAFHGVYAASKAALLRYSNSLRQECALIGIKVVHITTGAFESNLHSISQGADSLATYSSTFSKYAPNFLKHYTYAFSQVSHKDPEIWAQQLESIIHAKKPKNAYNVGVSLMESFSTYLPQSIFDKIISDGFKAKL